MEPVLRIIAAVAIIAALIFAARVLDKKWRAKYPEEKPFAWGYFQALCFFPAGLLCFIMPFFGNATSWELWVMIVVYGMFGSFAGYTLITKKKKWA